MDMDMQYRRVILRLWNYVESYSGLQVNPESDCARGHNCCPDSWVRLQGSLNGALKVLFSDPGRYKIKEPAAGPQRGLFIPSGPTLAEKNMKPKRGC